jgi:hypothetical protein
MPDWLNSVGTSQFNLNCSPCIFVSRILMFHRKVGRRHINPGMAGSALCGLICETISVALFVGCNVLYNPSI